MGRINPIEGRIDPLLSSSSSTSFFFFFFFLRTQNLCQIYLFHSHLYFLKDLYFKNDLFFGVLHLVHIQWWNLTFLMVRLYYISIIMIYFNYENWDFLLICWCGYSALTGPYELLFYKLLSINRITWTHNCFLHLLSILRGMWLKCEV